jgi:hypothetical protein
MVTGHISSSEADFRAKTRAFARRFSALGICGGDSSLTIAAEELAAAKFKGDLVFLPAGSVNDIVHRYRCLAERAGEAALSGRTQYSTGGKQFIGQANWGLGVVVNRWVGKVLTTLPALRRYQQTIGTLCIILAHLLRREKVMRLCKSATGCSAAIFLSYSSRSCNTGLRVSGSPPMPIFTHPSFR